MNCDEVRQHWNLYHDSEGDAELHFQVNEHLGGCPACAEWFAQQSRFEGLLADKLRSPARTPELWNRVLERNGLRKPAASRRLLMLTAVAAGVAAAILLWHLTGTGWLTPAARQYPPLAELTTAWHDRLAQGQEPVSFRSQSDLEVERYLRKQVSFPVRCPPRKDTGFEVEGAGVGKLGDQPTAYVAGKVEQTPVSIFVLPSDGLAAFREAALLRQTNTHRQRENDYTLVARLIDRNAVVVIGRTDAQRLERVLNAYGTYPD